MNIIRVTQNCIYLDKNYKNKIKNYLKIYTIQLVKFTKITSFVICKLLLII